MRKISRKIYWNKPAAWGHVLLTVLMALCLFLALTSPGAKADPKIASACLVLFGSLGMGMTLLSCHSFTSKYF